MCGWTKLRKGRSPTKQPADTSTLMRFQVCERTSARRSELNRSVFGQTVLSTKLSVEPVLFGPGRAGWSVTARAKKRAETSDRLSSRTGPGPSRFRRKTEATCKSTESTLTHSSTHPRTQSLAVLASPSYQAWMPCGQWYSHWPSCTWTDVKSACRSPAFTVTAHVVAKQACIRVDSVTSHDVPWLRRGRSPFAGRPC